MFDQLPYTVLRYILEELLPSNVDRDLYCTHDTTTSFKLMSFKDSVLRTITKNIDARRQYRHEVAAAAAAGAPIDIQTFRVTWRIDKIPSGFSKVDFYLFTRPIEAGFVPEGVKCVEFISSFSQSLLPRALPQSLVELRLGSSQHPLSIGSIPDNVETIDLGLRYEEPILPGILPASCRRLTLSQVYETPLQVGTLPPLLEELVFGYMYNQPLLPGHLPLTLKRLVFGSNFDQPLQNGSLPPLLRQLKFGHCYNQPIPNNVLPSSLSKLTFGNNYNTSLVFGSIPSSVHTIKFGWNYNMPLEVGSLPSLLTRLKMGRLFDQPLIPYAIPCSLRELRFGHKFNQPIPVGSLPGGVHTITFGDGFKCPDMYLPPSVHTVHLSYYFDHPHLLTNGIFDHVKRLLLSRAMAQHPKLFSLLPTSIVTLSFKETLHIRRLDDTHVLLLDDSLQGGLVKHSTGRAHLVDKVIKRLINHPPIPKGKVLEE
ncbi:hypothetical protein SAMD00019534_061320 [Acytostelium subglobosum LB1]|uniref:hypothetical protein n=1 Tax=Acytostelium subglobosum LB1 TaxID=1410327 RepID=UPI0006449148|nr:hypothetical protein SAMD00019534_061320 [Acytostelium subglobosum LB1]GAM22957.1 hypothetical protein SAMD00019534_061320 [Acytostelium subglobosum LB1]|eukprot:XP_012754184.1 hypothetical protein SAMD00019534_061320 [Acytostelium subglobosum LB1]